MRSPTHVAARSPGLDLNSAYRIRTALTAVVLPVLFATACATTPAPVPASYDVERSLTEANRQFRTTYGATRKSLLARTRPIIVVDFGRLVLLRRDKPDLEEPHNPPLYHRYKAIAHIPMTIYVALTPSLDGHSASGWRQSLEVLRDKVRPVLGELDALGFPAGDLPRQREIVTASLAFLDDALARPTIEPERVLRFARAMGELQLRNADAAAVLQIDRIHAIVSRWRNEELSADDWNRVYVVVQGFKMPRDGYAQLQYFERVLGAHESGRRLLYAEGLTTREAALDLLGTIVTDRGAAHYFFDDVMRMDRDVMADGATKHLDRIFGPRR